MIIKAALLRDLSNSKSDELTEPEIFFFFKLLGILILYRFE